MPPRASGKEKASADDDDDILQAVVLADSFKSRFGPLAMDLPRCLLPVCNTPLLDWTFEALASAGVQQVYVFCSSHAGLVRQAIDASPWSRPSSGLKITPIYSREARSVGDALREIDAKQIISSDFVLVSGDIISNIRIEDVVKEHKERRKLNKDAIMTSVVRQVGPRDRPRPGGDSTVIVMNAETSQCAHYEYVPHGKTSFEIPYEVISKHTDLDIRVDLLDCGIDICTPDVPALFTENFDYQDLRKDFVRGVLTSDLLSKTIYCHVVSKGYAARVHNTRMYATISKDIVARRTFPLVPDDNHLGGDIYDLRRGHVYISKSGVSLSRTCEIGNNTIIGSNCEILNDVQITSSIIGRSCEVGNRTQIRDSYVWDRTTIGADCIIEESIIGAHVKILDGTTIRRGCLIGKGVTLGPKANLKPFQRVSKVKPVDDDDDDDDENEAGDEDDKEDKEDTDDDKDEGEGWSEADDDQSVSHASGTQDSEWSSVASDIVSIVGPRARAYLWPDKDAEKEEGEEEDETPHNLKLGRLGDTGSDIELQDSDASDVETIGSSPPGSPYSGTSATSTSFSGGNIPSISLDSSADFLSECRQSLERADEEHHTIENASIELKTLRMASNVPIKRVAEVVVAFMVGVIGLVDAPAVQRTNVNAAVGRWGPLLTNIGWNDSPETILILQRYCAANTAYQKLFGQVLAALYNEDVVDFDDIKSWYGKLLGMKKQGLDAEDPLAATLDDSMQQAMRLIQQIHSMEEEDDEEEEESDEEESVKGAPAGNAASAKVAPTKAVGQGAQPAAGTDEEGETEESEAEESEDDVPATTTTASKDLAQGVAKTTAPSSTAATANPSSATSAPAVKKVVEDQATDGEEAETGSEATGDDDD